MQNITTLSDADCATHEAELLQAIDADRQSQLEAVRSLPRSMQATHGFGVILKSAYLGLLVRQRAMRGRKP